MTSQEALAQALHDAAVGHRDDIDGWECEPYHLDPNVPYPFPGEAPHERWRMHWDGAGCILAALPEGWWLSDDIRGVWAAGAKAGRRQERERLRAAVEDLYEHEFIDDYEKGTIWNAVDKADVLALIAEPAVA
jgi:hypothetical protein